MPGNHRHCHRSTGGTAPASHDRPFIDFFVSDSCPANPAAVAMFYEAPRGSRERWSPCWSHKVQLVCKHAVSLFVDDTFVEEDETPLEDPPNNDDDDDDSLVDEEGQSPERLICGYVNRRWRAAPTKLALAVVERAIRPDRMRATSSA